MNAKARHRRRNRAARALAKRCAAVTPTMRNIFLFGTAFRNGWRLQSFRVVDIKGSTAYARAEIIDNIDWCRNVTVVGTVRV